MQLCLQMAPAFRQRQELRLSLKMKPPSDWSFREPDAMKQVESLQGKRIIRITESEMASYASAVRAVRKLIEDTVPSVVLISMRGALPAFRATMQSMKPNFLDCEHRYGDEWDEKLIRRNVLVRAPAKRYLPSFAEPKEEMERLGWKYGEKKAVNMKAVKINTSYFLADLEENLEEGLRAAFRKGSRSRMITALFLDTSVSGTKLGWFMPQFKDAMKQVAKEIKRPVHLISAILHHDNGGARMCSGPEKQSDLLVTSRVDIGVESLIAEDSITLLGRQTSITEIAEEALGEVHASRMPEAASIMVGERLHTVEAEKSGDTATLFARIAGNMAGQHL
ncbi:hypothetical protein GF318_03090 [Candidatus Micrarchaeota archaeon]|nr:hypothetical protein [Candidatus Micrarchaeota archaeon]